MGFELVTGSFAVLPAAAFDKRITYPAMMKNLLIVFFANRAGAATFGKIMAAWLPVFIFFAQGFEHAVVNMFVIPSGMLLGAKVTLQDWWISNQLPATLGNIIGGVVFTGLALYLTHGRKKTSPTLT